MGTKWISLVLLGLLLCTQPLRAEPIDSPSISANQFLPLPIAPDPRLFFSDYPSFNSQRLDQQIDLYTRYLSVMGTPDVLIIGSSRSLQGVDPLALHDALIAQGYPSLRTYNFSINGATAQVVDLVIRRLLSPEHLPPLVIWADGLRAFNNHRVDATYNGIVTSLGYQQLLTGDRPIPLLTPQTSNGIARPRSFTSLAELHGLADLQATGFRSIATQFNPAAYYRQFPPVPGQYDSDYTPLRLEGGQMAAVVTVAQFIRDRQRSLVIVNLPIAQAHLDLTRRRREQQFQLHMEQLAEREGFIFRNLMGWRANESQYFADPSHLNYRGAQAVAFALAADRTIPWEMFLFSSSRPYPQSIEQPTGL